MLFNIDGRFHAIDDGCPHQASPAAASWRER